MDLRLKEDWAEILRCAPRPLTALLGVYYEALSPTTATARSGLGYWIYYKYTHRPPLWIPLVLGEVRSFRNLRDDSRLFYPLDITRAVRDLRVPALYGFSYGMLHVTDSALAARAPRISGS